MDVPAHLLPPEGPTRTALADQYQAATASTTRRAAALLGGGAVLLDNRGPWAGALLDSVAPDAGHRRLVCPAVARWNSPDTRFTFSARLLICPTCAEPMLEHGGAALRICGVCTRSIPGDLRANSRMVIAQRDINLAVGRMCLLCLTAEQLARRHPLPPGDPR